MRGGPLAFRAPVPVQDRFDLPAAILWPLLGQHGPQPGQAASPAEPLALRVGFRGLRPLSSSAAARFAHQGAVAAVRDCSPAPGGRSANSASAGSRAAMPPRLTSRAILRADSSSPRRNCRSRHRRRGRRRAGWVGPPPARARVVKNCPVLARGERPVARFAQQRLQHAQFPVELRFARDVAARHLARRPAARGSRLPGKTSKRSRGRPDSAAWLHTAEADGTTFKQVPGLVQRLEAAPSRRAAANLVDDQVHQVEAEPAEDDLGLSERTR